MARTHNYVDASLRPALDRLAGRAAVLRNSYHFDWPSAIEQAVQSLRFGYAASRVEVGQSENSPRVLLAAIVGGASSGKSTVFDNLLGQRLASRVTAKGHATLGPILAVHEARRPFIEALAGEGVFFPTFRVQSSSLDGNTTGSPEELHLVYHHVDAMRDVLLLDMPDFTSEPARLEGDIALALLPWFDRLIVLVDHERLFDAQTIGRLREESQRFGSTRLALFNRVRQERLSEDDRRRLGGQAERLDAEDYLILDYRRGRGLCPLPPDLLSRVVEMTVRPVPDRRGSLLRVVGRAASAALSQNLERRDRLVQLRTALDRTASNVPKPADCLNALLTPGERGHLDIVRRTLRLEETREWFGRQAARIRETVMGRIPIVGGLFNSTGPARPAPDFGGSDRLATAWQWFGHHAEGLRQALQRTAENSEFWEEVRRWTRDRTPAIEPPPLPAGLIDAFHDDVLRCAVNFNTAVGRWTEKVEKECEGAAPQVVGAVGGTALAGAIVLVMVTGPVGALTLPAAATALTAAFAKLAGSAVVGGLGGKPLIRLQAVIRERLLGSAEFDTVMTAAEAYRQLLAEFGRRNAGAAFDAAQALVMPEGDPTAAALESIADASEAAG